MHATRLVQDHIGGTHYPDGGLSATVSRLLVVVYGSGAGLQGIALLSNAPNTPEQPSLMVEGCCRSYDVVVTKTFRVNGLC